ncbi:sulfite exporter TauE/SafE family protein [Advenella sp. WQ 585]|uniref:Probable membrane transporter protein n=1 Tax=Advenella mandrilli TaxID=2800330 RepID=A0ABS1EDV8_9BURK|nr:sulfite exporter TauE/SafE family protein [Advenella mandrilli]
MILALLALGTFGGFMAGLLGVGGGMVLVPFLTMLFAWQKMPADLVVHAAIATSMGMIVFTSLSSMRAHHKKGAVMWSVVYSLVPGIILGGLLAGGVAFRFINTAWLALFFAVFVGYSAMNMLRNKKPKPSRQLPGIAGRTAVGAGIGFISGLVGAGGGFLSVPFMVWCNVSIRNAVATSAALGFPIAVGNSIGYISSGIETVGIQDGMLGYVYWPGLLVLITMSVLLAPVGAKCAHSWPVDRLKRIFACLLFSISAYMLYKSLTAFGVI